MKPSLHDPTLAALDAALMAAEKPINAINGEDLTQMRCFLIEHGTALRERLLQGDRSGTLLRLSARRYAAAFALICDVYAAIADEAAFSADLRAQVEAIATGCEVVAPSADGPVTPRELLTIAHRLAAVGETADAARLRRLADDLMAESSNEKVFVGIDPGAGDEMPHVAVILKMDGHRCLVIGLETIIASVFPETDVKANTERVTRYLLQTAAEGGAR